MNTVIIKVGGSVLTDKEEEFSLKSDVLEQVAEELASLEESFVLIHGGGSFGHPVASKYDISSGFSDQNQLIGFSETHRTMERLNSEVVGSLLEAGRPAVPVQTSACTVVEDGEITSMELRNVKKLLELGIVPVLYGDCVPDLRTGMTILSGDQLAAQLARELGASKVVLGVDTEGVMTGDPKEDEGAELIPEITPSTWGEVSASLGSTPGDDVTGGMRNKVEVLLDLADEGIESRVVNATGPGNLKKAIGTDIEVGTKITGD